MDFTPHMQPAPYDVAGPARRLWTSVVRQALADLQSPLFRGRAEMWFESSSELPRTFLWTCEAIRVSPDWVRRIAAQVRAGEVRIKGARKPGHRISGKIRGRDGIA